MKTVILLVSLLASSLAMACPQNKICPGDRVIDVANSIGRASEVFSNGKTTVEFDDYYGQFTRDTASLGKGIKCFRHICVGDRMIDSSNNVGDVKEVFDNGKARVSMDDFYGNFIRDVDSLGKGFRCIAGICVGDRSIDNSNETGKIVELFDNGKAKVSMDNFYGYFIRSFDSLGIQLKCTLRDNCSCHN